VLYRPARQAALAQVLATARQREGLQAAPTTLAGVRQMIRRCAPGEAVGLLPDQVPPEGQGLWAPFGQPAYTMTLAARLLQQTGATPLWPGASACRARAATHPPAALSRALSSDLPTAVGQINRAMEQLIAQCPGNTCGATGATRHRERPPHERAGPLPSANPAAHGAEGSPVTAALMFFMRQLARLPCPCCARGRRRGPAAVRAGAQAPPHRARQPAPVLSRLSEARVQAVARRSFVLFSQAFFDRAWLWHAPPAVVRQRLRITGATEDLTRPGAVVMFAPHFYGMDAGGSAVMDQIERPACTIYSTQSNPAIDAWMRAGRLRFGQATLLSRQEGLKPIVRALREGKMLYLLPDMDLGPQESIFVPFFGIATATVPSLPRFAWAGARGARGHAPDARRL
jgi:KDO2-lipid IV(A) lauroyltransferase